MRISDWSSDVCSSDLRFFNFREGRGFACTNCSEFIGQVGGFTPRLPPKLPTCLLSITKPVDTEVMERPRTRGRAAHNEWGSLEADRTQIRTRHADWRRGESPHGGAPGRTPASHGTLPPCH